uniref:Retrotransposon protein n=2 Tax=Oryza sativa subsp. japonica TaxID=39947 RepID=Q10H42_ORYSJ|nr:putative retrotransposon protein [Oryza sativa Japonica Group]ABF97504.1 retrotransposon protein, putative, Ty3-gypsy subclass [Oryza sativa Japonica Group]
MAKEIHQGLCGAHQAARTVASKVFRQGVYWLTVLKVCLEQIKKCESCQRHGRSQTAPQYELQPIAPIWPFARWGLDIIGPFPAARNGHKFTIVAVEYFSRWIEAEPLVCQKSSSLTTAIDSNKLREICEGFNLEIRFASVTHPQSNGVAERTNGKILEALKKRLEGAAKGKWPEEMLSVLWALRTTPTRPTKFSPFMLLYSDEAMTPTELGANSVAWGQQRGASCRSNSWRGKKANPIAIGKLESKWEGPYLIKHKSRTGSFRLVTLEGEEFDHS